MTHSERMISHLISQFQGKPVIKAELNAFGYELDALDSALYDLMTKRWIDTGEGIQLDNIGTLVNRGRVIDNAAQLAFFGFSEQPNTLTFGVGCFRLDGESWMTSTTLNDDRYRKILWLKVFKDISNATVNDILHALSAVFEVPHVSLNEIGNAKLFIGIGRRLRPDDIYFMQAIDLTIRAGGVGIHAIENYDSDNFLGFSDQRDAKGFGIGCFADIVNGG